MIATTSRDAFKALMDTTVPGDQTAMITSYLRWNGPATRHQIAEDTGICLQSVCGRVYRLIDQGRVEVVGTMTVFTTLGRACPRQVIRLVPDLIDHLEES